MKKKIIIILTILAIFPLTYFIVIRDKSEKLNTPQSFIIPEIEKPKFIQWIDNSRLLVMNDVSESTTTILVYDILKREKQFETYVNSLTKVSINQELLICSPSYFSDNNLNKTELSVYKINLTDFSIIHSKQILINDDVLIQECLEDNLILFSKNPNLLYPQNFEYLFINDKWELSKQSTTTYENINIRQIINNKACNTDNLFCYEITDSGYLIIKRFN